MELRLPYVEDKILQALQSRDKYVDLARLLPQRPRLEPTKASCRITVDADGAATVSAAKSTVTINSATQWCQAFSIFSAYHTFYFPHLALGLMSYMSFMTSKMVTHPLQACLNYDVDFRKRLSLYPASMRWETPDQGILDTAFNNPKPPSSVEALRSQGRRAQTSTPQSSQEPCKRFNVKHCASANCSRPHVCFICAKPHAGADHYNPVGPSQPQRPTQQRPYQQRPTFQNPGLSKNFQQGKF